MTLVHGREITAEQVEQIVGREFSVQRFASLCNALTWAVSKPGGVAQMAFTERVFVADSGVDAEWEIELPDFTPRQGSFLNVGRSVLQYKQRDVTARDRSGIVGDLRRNLRGAAKEVVHRTGRSLDSYLLFTNVSLTLDQKRELVESIKEDCATCGVQVVGAAEIAALLNNFPHIRSAYFTTAPFTTWQRFWEGHNKESLSGTVPNFIGRKEAADGAKAAVDDDSVRAILFAGPPDIGKTRLALNCTQHRPFETICAIDGRSVTVTDLIAVEGTGGAVVVVVDDPDTEATEELIAAALSEEIKIVLTVPSSSAANLVNYGRDSRVKVITVGSLSDDESRALLQAADARMDYSVESWVIDQAGGNPGVLIVAAAVGSTLRIEGRNFLAQVANALEERARELLGDQRLDLLRDMSVMTAVGVGDQAAVELETVCATFGRRPNDILREVRTMADSGLLRVTGSYIEVVPPVFANHLAHDAVAGRTVELVRLFVALPALGRARLLKRLRHLQTQAVRRFWDELFQTGTLSTFAGALAQVQLLRLVVSAVPERVARLLQEGLTPMPLETRLDISGTVRRELVWTIEQMLFRRATAGTALRLLALLAEAENETWSNNCTGVFAECFHPMHPQLPLPVGERLTIIRELLGTGVNKRRKQVALKAAEEAFGQWGAVTLRRSEGPEPFDAVPTVTYGEIREYLRSLLELVRPLLQDGDQEIASAAGKTLMTSIGEFTVQADPDRGATLLEELGPRILAQQVPISLEDYVQSLKFARRALESGGQKFEGALTRICSLLRTVDEGSFEVQVKRWVGSWEYGEQANDENGHLVFRGDLEIRRLAQVAAQDPPTISNELLTWLTSPDARRSYEFFYWLGKCDRNYRWRERVEELGETSPDYRAFASYFGGRGFEDAERINTRLDELTNERKIKGAALVAATGYLPANRPAVTRVTDLLRSGRVDAEFAEKALIGGGWMKPLNCDEAATLLTAIAGPEFENAWPVIDFLAMWVHSRKPIEGDLAEVAWRALEATPNRGQAWDFDIVAAALALGNPDRAFALLARYLTLPSDRNSWEPLDRHGGNRFWNTLWTLDSSRCIENLLEVAAESPLTAWKISWHLPEILDLTRDRDLLLRFAGRTEKNAEFVSSCLESKEGFWPLALELLSQHPDNRVIRGNVESAAGYMKRVITGPLSEHYNRCAQEVEEVHHEAKTPDAVKTFLADLARHLREHGASERRSEQDESVNW